MTPADIYHMAHEAARSNGSPLLDCTLDDLGRFAALVAAAEREECAKVCENLWLLESYPGSGARGCAFAIRARGEKP